MIIDCRCPQCNKNVLSLKDNVNDVQVLKRKPTRKDCVNCMTPIKLVESDQGPGFEGVETYYFADAE